MISLTSPPPDPSPPALHLEASSSQEREPRSWAQRVLWTLVGLVILNWSITLFGPASYFPPIALLVVLAGFWGLLVAVVSWLDLEDYPQLRRWENAFAWANAILVVVLIGAWTYVQFHSSPAYTTDELSFDQYAAQIVAHGLSNPYTHSMAPAVPMFRLSPDAYTYTITGTPVKQMSYPSLAFLVYVPFILLGWTTEVAAGLNVIAWVVAILLMFALLPRRMRAAALVLSSVDVYLSFAAGGVTDMLYIPLLLVAAYRWDRFGTSRSSYIGPVAVGLAMAIKQTPWPVLAFVLCAIAWDQYDLSGEVGAAARRAGRYFGAVLVAFLIPNLPYMIASPSGWVSGVLAPFVRNMVPSGQGVISLTLFAHLGGGSLAAYTVAMVLVSLLLLVVFVGTYPLLRPATFLLPSIAYFFAARSQTNYLIPLIPVGLVGAVTAGHAVKPARLARVGGRLAALRSLRWGAGISLVLALSVAVLVYALSAPPPLSVSITGIHTTGYLGGIDRLTLRVHNKSGKRLAPVYTIQTSHGDTTFYDVAEGAKSLAPHTTARVVIAAPNYPADPGLGDGFSVLAFVDKPASVSVSHRYLLNLWRTAFMPQSFNGAVPVGKRLRLQVQILDHFDNPVRRKGIAVYLGQSVYGSLGVRHASAQIDGNQPGKPGVAYTNRDGLATFDVVGTEPHETQISFSAHLRNKAAQYVYASSGYLYIRFKR